MQHSTPVKSFVSESLLWVLANVLGVLVPVGATYGLLSVILERPVTQVSAGMTVMALLTLTWGSWSGLVWARNRVLRASMRVMTVLPGLLLLGLAGAGAYITRGGLVYWLALLGSGVGTIAASYMISRTVSAMPASQGSSGYFAGIAIFPILATAGAVAVGYLWYLFVSNPLQTDWRSLFSFAFLFVSTLSVVFISTVVPAVTTMLCRQVVSWNR